VNLEAIVAITTALGLGMGYGLPKGISALVAAGKRRSKPPSGNVQQEPINPRLTDSQRIDMPFTLKDTCHERHERIDARLAQADERYEGMHQAYNDICVQLAELRTEVRMAIGLPPIAAPVRRGGSAGR
jgi:hypothetical protein